MSVSVGFVTLSALLICTCLTGIKILNTIKWTDGMDQYFKENDKEDPTLLWQYFGSSDGVYRVYPGKITGQAFT